EGGGWGVADRAGAGSATEDYRGEPPSGTPPERARVALVPGSGAVAADHPYRLLRRRLLVVCSIVAGLYFVMVSINVLVSLTSSDPTFRAPLSGSFRPSCKILPLMITGLGSTAVLWRRPPRTIGGLRIMELIVFGIMALSVLQGSVVPFSWSLLEDAVEQPSERTRLVFVMGYTFSVALQWFLILTLYGT